MGRNITSTGSTYTTGDIIESVFQPPNTIPANGATLLKSEYSELASLVGDEALRYSMDTLQQWPATAGGAWASKLSSNAFNCDFQTDGSQFVFTNGTFIFVSPDAIKWKPVAVVPSGLNANTNNAINKLKYRNGVWFAYAAGFSNNGYLTSVDGVTWTLVYSPVAFKDMTWDGTNYMLVNDTAAYYGANLNSLTKSTIAVAVHYVEKIGINYVAWPAGTATNTYIGTGTSWVTQSTGYTLGNRYSIANGHLFISRYVEAASRPLFIATSDGIVWVASGSSIGGNNHQPSASCVVWDGATYSIGMHDTTYAGGSKIYVTATITGVATTLTNNGDTYQSSYAGALIAFKPGTYAFIWGNNASTVYVTTATPTAAWGLREAYAQGIAYPFMPLQEYSSFAIKESAATPGVVVSSHNSLNSGAATYYVHIFIEDDNKYYEPYKYSTNYWAINTSTTFPQRISAVGNYGNSIFLYLSNSSLPIYLIDADRELKTLIHTAKVSADSALDWVVATKTSFVFCKGVGSVVRIMPYSGASLIALSSMSGYAADDTVQGFSYNQSTGELLVQFSYNGGSGWGLGKTMNGSSWTFYPAPPEQYDSNGTLIAASTGYKIYTKNGVYFANRSSTVTCRSTSLARLDQVAKHPAETFFTSPSCVVTKSDNVILSSDTSQIGISYNGRGRAPVTRSTSGVIMGDAYEFDFGTVICAQTNSTNVATSVINLINTPPNTHFKIPSIYATDTTKLAYITV